MMKTMAPILATTLGIFDIVVPGSNREALASYVLDVRFVLIHTDFYYKGRKMKGQ